MKTLIVFDTETTGLPRSGPVPLTQQPEIIEFAAVKLNLETLEEIASLDFLLKPRILPLPQKIIEITSITDAMLKEQSSFAAKLPALVDFFMGTNLLVAHNLPFDLSLLSFELQRLERQYRFPWPPDHFCTVDNTRHVKGRRMKMAELYEHYVGGTFPDAHRAMNDVRALVKCLPGIRADVLL